MFVRCARTSCVLICLVFCENGRATVTTDDDKESAANMYYARNEKVMYALCGLCPGKWQRNGRVQVGVRGCSDSGPHVSIDSRAQTSTPYPTIPFDVVPGRGPSWPEKEQPTVRYRMSQRCYWKSCVFPPQAARAGSPSNPLGYLRRKVANLSAFCRRVHSAPLKGPTRQRR